MKYQRAHAWMQAQSFSVLLTATLPTIKNFSQATVIWKSKLALKPSLNVAIPVFYLQQSGL
jgi:hypothetical protein